MGDNQEAIFHTFIALYRKVRVITDLYVLPVEYVDVGSVVQIGFEKFGDNPLMGVPVLSDDNIWLIDSDNISAYLIKNFGSPSITGAVREPDRMFLPQNVLTKGTLNAPNQIGIYHWITRF